MAVSNGGELVSTTSTANDCVALRLGVPSSWTTTQTKLLLGPCASDGVQLMTPELVLIVIPPGAALRPKVSTFGGRSASLMTFVKLKLLSSTTVWLLTAPSTGGEF